MIVRIWHGWTSAENADAYQQVVDEQVVPGIMARGLVGLRGVDILRRIDGAGAEVEFVTIMTFDDWEAVEEFAGPGGRTSFVPPEARKVLSRFDETSQHYALVGRHPAVAPTG